MEEERKIEKLDMSKKPSQEIAVFGLGALLNKIDDLTNRLDRMAKIIYFMEQRQQKWFEAEHPELKEEKRKY